MNSLNNQTLLINLPEHVLSCIKDLEIVDSVGSTNTVVLDKFMSGNGAGYLCLAEQQTAGRGRHGRPWYSPHKKNIYLSFGCTINLPLYEVRTLSLVIGYKVASRLTQLGVNGVSLKWPNDVLVNGCKICGILIELASSTDKNVSSAVIGLGINVNMLTGFDEISAPSTSILSYAYEKGWPDALTSLSVEHNRERIICRNQLAKFLIVDIIEGIISFQRIGFVGFYEEWKKYDCLKEKHVTYMDAGRKIIGIGRGVDLSGEYLVEVNSEIRSLVSENVSIRKQI